MNAGQISNCTTLGRFDRQQCKEVALAVSTGKIIAHVGDDDGGGEGDDHQDQTSRTPEICWVCQDTLEIHQTLCHQISATATDCIQAIAILWASALIPHRPQGIFVSIDGKYCENDALEG